MDAPRIERGTVCKEEEVFLLQNRNHTTRPCTHGYKDVNPSAIYSTSS